jgi:hypothetical protein
LNSLVFFYIRSLGTLVVLSFPPDVNLRLVLPYLLSQTLTNHKLLLLAAAPSLVETVCHVDLGQPLLILCYLTGGMHPYLCPSEVEVPERNYNE